MNVEEKAKLIVGRKYMEFIKTHTYHTYVEWNWEKISDYKYLTMVLIEENIDCDWDWGVLSENEDMVLTPDFIEKYIDKPWDWMALSMCRSFDIIEQRPDFPWDWHEMSMRRDLTFEFIQKHVQKPWNWDYITSQGHLTMDFIKKHPQFSYDWKYLSKFMPISDILDTPQLPWDWEYVTDNAELTMDIITQHAGKPWNWHELTHRSFSLDYDMIYGNLVAIEKGREKHKDMMKKIVSEMAEFTYHPDNISFMRDNELIVL